MISETHMRRFVFLVLGLSIPFYVLGTLGTDGDDVVALPVSALAVVVPLTAAAIVTRWSGGAVRQMLVDGVKPAPTHNTLWTVIALGTMPALLIATHAPTFAPDPNASSLTLPAAGGLMAVFLVGAYAEEIGWTAFATRRLLERHSVLTTGLFVGMLWAVWHVIPFVQTNNSWSWVGWQLAFIVAFRVLIVSLYAASGRTALVAVLIHASYNMAWTLLPLYWSSYDPAVLAPLTAVAALGALLAQGRFAQAAESSGRPIADRRNVGACDAR